MTAPVGGELGWTYLERARMREEIESTHESSLEEERGLLRKACFDAMCKDIDLFFSRQNADQINFSDEHAIKSLFDKIKESLDCPRGRKEGMPIYTFNFLTRSLEIIKWLKVKEYLSKLEKPKEKEIWINDLVKELHLRQFFSHHLKT